MKIATVTKKLAYIGHFVIIAAILAREVAREVVQEAAIVAARVVANIKIVKYQSMSPLSGA